MESKITCIYGNNKYRDVLVYDIVYEYVKTNIFKFGVVIGEAYPYYKYISDNVYIKYDEEILEEYLNNITRLYVNKNGKIDDNLLIVHSDIINLNTKSWDYLLNYHHMFKTHIIIIIDHAMDYNINKLNKYVNVLYILKNKENEDKYIEEVYNIFFTKMHKHILKNIYNESTKNELGVLISELNENLFYKYKINIELPEYTFDTYKIYEENKIYKQRCNLSDIINI